MSWAVALVSGHYSRWCFHFPFFRKTFFLEECLDQLAYFLGLTWTVTRTDTNCFVFGIWAKKWKVDRQDQKYINGVNQHFFGLITYCVHTIGINIKKINISRFQYLVLSYRDYHGWKGIVWGRCSNIRWDYVFNMFTLHIV